MTALELTAAGQYRPCRTIPLVFINSITRSELRNGATSLVKGDAQDPTATAWPVGNSQIEVVCRLLASKSNYVRCNDRLRYGGGRCNDGNKPGIICDPLPLHK